MGVGCVEELVRSLATKIHYKVEKLSVMYLGLSIKVRTNTRLLWNPIIEKVENKLSTWKRRYLSLGRTITLIKACLSNLPVHYMSLFKLPKFANAMVDRLRNFLWEGQSDSRKIHPLKKKEVIKYKKEGGLGLGSLDSKNWALLAK